MRDRTLFDGYSPVMEQVHLENAERLEAILDDSGWPGTSCVGRDGAEAAWIVAQHAISRPGFQRRCLELLNGSVEIGEATPAHAAHLEDRIRFNQRRPQLCGTVFDWDEHGCMSPWTIERAEQVDERRERVGLPPLAEVVARMRTHTEAEGNGAPDDYRARQWEIESWAREVGWI